MTNPAVIGTHQANPWIDNIMNYMEAIFPLHNSCTSAVLDFQSQLRQPKIPHKGGGVRKPHIEKCITNYICYPCNWIMLAMILQQRSHPRQFHIISQLIYKGSNAYLSSFNRENIWFKSKQRRTCHPLSQLASIQLSFFFNNASNGKERIST